MAALLAHAARVNARERLVRLPHTLSRSSSLRNDVCHLRAWRGSQLSIEFKSYSTDGSETTVSRVQDSHNPSAQAAATKTKSAFMRVIASHTKRIEQLGKSGDFDMILRAVYEYYRPLYTIHTELEAQGMPRVLWDACDDASSASTKEMRMLVTSHNDVLTQYVEVKAMEVLLANKQPQMAVAVGKHREAIAAALGTVKDEKSGRKINLYMHRREFEPLRKRALSDLRANTEAPEHLARRHEAIARLRKQHILWMQELADRGEFDRLLREVYECYKPLYTDELLGHECSLWDACADATTAAQSNPRFNTKVYNNRRTQHVEITVARHFLAKDRPDLVVAVYNHRRALATKLSSVPIASTGSVVDLSWNHWDFSRIAMRAFQAVGEHAEVVHIYETICAAGTTPVDEMTTICVVSRIALGDLDAVRALYEDVKRDQRPVTRYFYAHMLYFAGLVRDRTIMVEILETMKGKAIPLRDAEYLSAMRSLQDKPVEYSRRDGKDGGLVGPSKEPLETYRDCLTRITRQSVSSHAYNASKQVLSLFDEMLHVAKLEVHSRMVFVYAARAALLVEELDRVPQLVALFEQVFDYPIGGRMLVDLANAFLLRNEPVAAWELVIKACPAPRKVQKQQQPAVSFEVLASFTNVLQYLKMRQDIALTHRFLNALKARALLSQLTQEQHDCLIDAVVLDTTHVDDAAIMAMLRKYAAAFRVVDKPSSLEAFANACMASGRWSLLGQVLKTRNLEQIPWLADSMAVRISESALEDESNRDRMELAVEMVRAVDLASLSDADRTTLSTNAARADDVLHNTHKDSEDSVETTSNWYDGLKAWWGTRW